MTKAKTEITVRIEAVRRHLKAHEIQKAALAELTAVVGTPQQIIKHFGPVFADDSSGKKLK